MTHEVFICFSSQDQKTADAACSKLESEGISCWISSRDMGAGWFAQKLLDAVNESRILVLIFSANSNSSEYCINEVYTAFNKKNMIIPLMIDAAVPSGDMAFYLQRFQQIDARTPPLEKHLQRLANEIKTILSQINAREAAAKEKARREAEAKAKLEAETARKEKEAEEKARQEASFKTTREDEAVKKAAEAAAREKERLEAEEARKAREAALKVQKEAEAARKERERLQAETAKARKEAEEARKAREAALKAAKEEKEQFEAEAAKARKETEEARKTREAALKIKVKEPPLEKRRVKAKTVWLFTGGVAVAVVLGILFFTQLFPRLISQGAPMIPNTTTTTKPAVIQPSTTTTPAVTTTLNYLEGYVRDTATNASIANATVEVFLPDQDQRIASALSDSSGYYKTSSFSTGGHYILKITASGYPTQWYNNITDKTYATHITLKQSGETLTVNLLITKGGSISGKVVSDADGKGIPNVTVALLEPGTENKVASADTDASGAYIMSNLTSGTYIIKAFPSTYQLAYIDEYYDNVSELGEAQSIKISLGQDVTGIDFSLTPGASISGKVVADADGKGIPKVTICIIEPNTGRWITTTSTNSEGIYIVNNLLAGSYKIQAWPWDVKPVYAAEYYENTISSGIAKTITLNTGQSITVIDFSLASGGTISGTVRNADGSTPLANVGVECNLFIDGVNVNGYGIGADSLGNYTFQCLPYGEYIVRSPPIGKWAGGDDNYVTEHYNGQPLESLAQHITVGPGINPTGIDFTLTTGGSISGKIVSDITLEGIADLLVYAYDVPTGESISHGVTAADGTYTIHGLPTGSYKVNTNSSWAGLPYADEYYFNATSIDLATPVPVTAGQNTPNINFTLSAGSISGKLVSDIDNRGIPDVTVIVLNANTGWEKARAVTNSDGDYTVSKLPAGTYKVLAQPSSNQLTYIDEYYDNSTSYESAKTITVSIGQSMTGIDFSLAPAASISGKIISDVTGTGIANVHVFASDYYTNRWMSGTNTDSDGLYKLGNLPPGTYTIRASPAVNKLPYADEYYNNTFDFSKAQGVTVATGQDVTGINVSLAPGGTISGIVKNSNGSQPLANILVECWRVTQGVWEWYSNATTDNEGKYTIYGAPYGQYFVRARGTTANTNYVLEYYPEKKRQADAALITISADSNPVNINFTLDAGGSISGRVVSETTFEAIPNVHIDAFDYDTGEWIGCAETAADGTYTVYGLSTGRYRVYTNTSLYQLPYIAEYYNNTLSYDAARFVSVTAGQNTPNINFSLAPAS